MTSRTSYLHFSIIQIFIVKKLHCMNKYHNWPDTREIFSPQNGVWLFQTKIFLSILNMRPTQIQQSKVCGLSYTVMCVTQNFPKHKCSVFCFAQSYLFLFKIEEGYIYFCFFLSCSFITFAVGAVF